MKLKPEVPTTPDLQSRKADARLASLYQSLVMLGFFVVACLFTYSCAHLDGYIDGLNDGREIWHQPPLPPANPSLYDGEYGTIKISR